MKMEETNKGKKQGTTSEHNINTGKTFIPDNNEKKEKNVIVVDLLIENAATQFQFEHECASFIW